MADPGPAPSVPRLITFPPSSDCENARWVFDHYGIAYREEPHGRFPARALDQPRARRAPMYIDPDVRLSGLTAIVQHFEALAAPDRRLVPPAQKDEIERLLDSSDVIMDKTTVTWAYTVYYENGGLHDRPAQHGRARPRSIFTVRSTGSRPCSCGRP